MNTTQNMGSQNSSLSRAGRSIKCTESISPNPHHKGRKIVGLDDRAHF